VGRVLAQRRHENTPQHGPVQPLISIAIRAMGREKYRKNHALGVRSRAGTPGMPLVSPGEGPEIAHHLRRGHYRRSGVMPAIAGAELIVRCTGPTLYPAKDPQVWGHGPWHGEQLCKCRRQRSVSDGVIPTSVTPTIIGFAGAVGRVRERTRDSVRAALDRAHCATLRKTCK